MRMQYKLLSTTGAVEFNALLEVEIAGGWIPFGNHQVVEYEGFLYYSVLLTKYTTDVTA